MKRIILQILIIALSLNNLIGQADSIFSLGNKLYSEGRFEEAISTYQEIMDSGFESPELYYNMGNAAFRSNKIGYAVLYFQKALKADPGFEEAERNLNYVSLYLEDKLDSVPQLFLKRWVYTFFNFFPLIVWSVISLTLFFFFLATLLLYVFGSKLWLKKTGFIGAAVSVLIFSLSFSAAIYQHKSIKQPERAVIVAPSVVVKSSPSDSGTDLFVLHEGTSLYIDEAVGEWIEVKIIDGRVGWLRTKVLEII